MRQQRSTAPLTSQRAGKGSQGMVSAGVREKEDRARRGLGRTPRVRASSEGPNMSLSNLSGSFCYEFPDLYFYYSAAMLNALVIANVTLAGEYVHFGKKYERKPLFLSALCKAFLFSLLVFGFYHVEEVIK